MRSQERRCAMDLINSSSATQQQINEEKEEHHLGNDTRYVDTTINTGDDGAPEFYLIKNVPYYPNCCPRYPAVFVTITEHDDGAPFLETPSCRFRLNHSSHPSSSAVRSTNTITHEEIDGIGASARSDIFGRRIRRNHENSRSLLFNKNGGTSVLSASTSALERVTTRPSPPLPSSFRNLLTALMVKDAGDNSSTTLILGDENIHEERSVERLAMVENEMWVGRAGNSKHLECPQDQG